MIRRQHIANGAAIRAIREALGWESQQLAAAANISPAYMSSLENGQRYGSPRVLRQLADALQVPLTAIRQPAPPRETP